MIPGGENPRKLTMLFFVSTKGYLLHAVPSFVPRRVLIGGNFAQVSYSSGSQEGGRNPRKRIVCCSLKGSYSTRCLHVCPDTHHVERPGSPLTIILFRTLSVPIGQTVDFLTRYIPAYLFETSDFFLNRTSIGGERILFPVQDSNAL